MKETEIALVAEVRRSFSMLFDAKGIPYSVAHGPGIWDGDYLVSLLDRLPAARVSFVDAVAAPGTDLSFAPVRWSILLVVGWTCATPEERMIGAQGLHTITACVATDLHNTALNSNGRRIGFLSVERLDNLWQGEHDRANISVVELTVSAAVPMPRVHQADIDDLLTSGVTWQIEPDAPQLADLITFMQERANG